MILNSVGSNGELCHAPDEINARHAVKPFNALAQLTMLVLINIGGFSDPCVCGVRVFRMSSKISHIQISNELGQPNDYHSTVAQLNGLGMGHSGAHRTLSKYRNASFSCE